MLLYRTVWHRLGVWRSARVAHFGDFGRQCEGGVIQYIVTGAFPDLNANLVRTPVAHSSEEAHIPHDPMGGGDTAEDARAMVPNGWDCVIHEDWRRAYARGQSGREHDR